MKVLVATTDGQGERPGDYCWCVDGELVTPVVVERPAIDRAKLEGAVRDALRRTGWLQGLSRREAQEVIEEHVSAIIQVCSHFPVGTVVGRSDTLVMDRAA